MCCLRMPEWALRLRLESVTEDQIDEQFDVNFKGVFFTIQKAVPSDVAGWKHRPDNIVLE